MGPMRGPFARYALLAVCAALPALLAGCGDRALDRLAQGEHAQVAEVPTGDQLVLGDGRRVKLAGIDAPKGDAPYAEAAREALRRLVAGRQVELLYGGAHQDPFGRTVAQVRTVGDRRWLEAALLDAGAARVRTYPDNRALARDMLEREAGARRGRRGLWAVAAYRVRLPGEVGPDAGGFQIVEGRVWRAGRFARGVFLDFGRNWRETVSLEIPGQAMRDFRAAGLDPLQLEGRLIRARGTVQGRRLLIDHPEQIEVLASS